MAVAFCVSPDPTQHSGGKDVEVQRIRIRNIARVRSEQVRGSQPGYLSFSSAAPNPDASPADPKGPPFLDALRQQLGLKLVSSKGPIRKLVIDHAEPPSPN
jgi:uncharacterized protein (TIGR03435 family)